jgi:LacI family transcriptional regulator
MRKRVMAAIGALGYEPDLLAQSLRRGSTRTVGFVVRDISNPLFADIVRGAETRLRAAEYSVVLTNSDGDPSLDAAHIQLLNRRRVDGLILSLESERHPPTLTALRDVAGPLVLLDREVPAVRASAVISDHYRGVRQGVLDMVRRPDSRVAFLGGPEAVRATRDRLRGYLDALEVAGRDIDDPLIRTGSYNAEFGYSETRALLSSVRPTGILAGGAQLSLGALEAIRDAELRPGHDIDLVAADGGPMMKYFDPPISAIERDCVDFGETAAELLVDMLEGNAAPRVVSLPTKYVRRSSVRDSLTPATG